MRKNDLQQKTYTDHHFCEIDRKINECFNEYGYNYERQERQSVSLDEVACKTGPNCRTKGKCMEKR